MYRVGYYLGFQASAGCLEHVSVDKGGRLSSLQWYSDHHALPQALCRYHFLPSSQQSTEALLITPILQMTKLDPPLPVSRWGMSISLGLVLGIREAPAIIGVASASFMVGLHSNTVPEMLLVVFCYSPSTLPWGFCGASMFFLAIRVVMKHIQYKSPQSAVLTLFVLRIAWVTNKGEAASGLCCFSV